MSQLPQGVLQTVGETSSDSDAMPVFSNTHKKNALNSQKIGQIQAENNFSLAGSGGNNKITRPVYQQSENPSTHQSKRSLTTGKSSSAQYKSVQNSGSINTTNSGAVSNKLPKIVQTLNSDVESSKADSSQEEEEIKKHKRRKKQSSQTHNREKIADEKKFVDLDKKDENLNLKRSIEIQNGIPKRRSNAFHMTKNDVNLHCYIVSELQPLSGTILQPIPNQWISLIVQIQGFYGFLWFIYDLVMQADHVILLINLGLEVISTTNSLSEYSHIIATACISLLGTGLMNILADNKLKEAADAINNKPIERFVFFKKSRRFVVSKWSEIQCGDIIKIKMNQEIPCDAMILDITGSKSGIQTCYTRGGLFDDDSNPSLKRSYQGTMNKTGQRISAAKFVDQISGVVKWEYNHQGYFSGNFKQENSPAAFDITPENIVQRGCYMQNATQAICLALNVGHNTMGNQFYDDISQGKLKQFLKRRQKTNHFESVHFTALRYIQYISIVFCLMPCIMIILQYLILNNLNSIQFVKTFSEDFQLSIESYTIILSGFMQNFPYLAKLTMEAVIFFHAYYTMWDVNLVPAQINYTNLKIMQSMGQIDSIVCPKSAFLWHNTCYTVAFKINQKIYYNQNEKNERIAEEEAFKNKGKDCNLNDSIDSEDDNAYERLDYLPNQIGFDPSFHNQNAQEMIRDSSSRDCEMFKELLMAIVLCHHATANKSQITQDGYSRQTYKSLYKDEEAQLHFAHSFKFKFISRKKRVVTIHKEGLEHQYDELLIRRIKVGEDYLTVSVVKPKHVRDSGLIIYYRANLRLLIKFLTSDEASVCTQDYNVFKAEGIHAFGIAKHVVQPENAVEFLRIINYNVDAHKLLLKQDKNDQFLLRIARKLIFIGVFGVQVAFNYRDTLVIEDLRKNGIKLYMLSGEDVDDVHTDCNAMNLLEGFMDPIMVAGASERQVEESLKTCLKEVLKRRHDERGKHKKEDEVKFNKKPKANKEAKEAQEDKELKRLKPLINKGKNHKKQSKEEAQNKKNRSDLKIEYQAADVDKVKEKNVIFFNGAQLEFILRDQTLEKLFLSLCNLCSLCIGSSVSPIQRKYVVKAIRQFAVQGKLGNVISIISQQADKFTIGEADITVGLIQNYKQSDVLGRTDVQMKNLYGLTYLFFRHGTLAHRRAKIVMTEFIGRTVTTLLIAFFFFFVNGFSYMLPYTRFFFSFYMAVLTPIQFFMQGISHTDYGYNVFHRIFGEYRFNLIQQVSVKDFFEVFTHSFLDAGFFMLCYFSSGAVNGDYQVDSTNGQPISWQSHLILNDILLSIINIYRARSIKSSLMLFTLSNYFFFLLSLITVLEDERLDGFNRLFKSGHAVHCAVFVFIFCTLKQFVRLVIEITLPCNQRIQLRYKAIEDLIFMEEYENPEQQFTITSLESYSAVAKSLEANSVFSINQNLLIVERSDSMDHILERLNMTSERKNGDTVNIYMTGNVSAFINQRNLKLHDINKEIEYNQNSIQIKKIEQILPLLWSSVILFATLLIFKITNSIIESRETLKSASSTFGSTAATSYYEVLQVILSASVIFSIKKLRFNRSYVLVMLLITISNVMIVTKFFTDQQSPLIQVQFLYTIAFSFGIRMTSFFFVSIVTTISCIAFLLIRLAVIKDQANSQKESSSNFQLSWMSFVMVTYEILWIYYAYQDEMRKKVQFVTQYRRIKEYQKLKSIINILIPGIVRSKIKDGKKLTNDQMSFATVIWMQIDSFDFLVKKYHGRDFTELLEKIFNGLDSLCQRYGLQVTDTIGKTFVACGGLKFCEKDLDPRLLTSHHSVRVIEFAIKAQAFMQSINLKDGRKGGISIGIHSGEVMCGVVGETKPQFSILGINVDKAAQIAQITRPDSIMVSFQTYKATRNQGKNFNFEEQNITIGGKSHTTFLVLKRRINNRQILHDLKKKKKGKKENTSSPKNFFIYNNQKDEQEQSDDEIDQKEQAMSNEDNDSVQSSDKGSVASSQKRVNQNESAQGESSVNGSLEEDGFNLGIFTDMKDDRTIVKIPALNDKYKLVERPRFLISFSMVTWESKFATSVFQKYFQTELCTYFTKGIIDLLLSMAIVYAEFGTKRLEIFIYVSIGVIAIKVLDTMLLFFRKVKKPRGIIYQLTQYGVTFILIILLGPMVLKLVYRESIEVTFAMYMMLAFLTQSFQFKSYAILIIVLSIGFTVHNLFEVYANIINMQTFAIESTMNFIFVQLLITLIYNREMHSRKIYNNERIIEVEIRRTEDQLNKLIPEHALAGIKNDQKVIDVLENVSVLYSNLVGFSEYYKMVKKPLEVVSLLNRLFSKFDSLCEQNGVYKVHTLGDIYVVMGYSGKIAREKRTIEDAVNEAYTLIQVAFQMSEIIQEERSRLKDPLLRNLDVKIGINTGRVVGGIIGTKVARYDIFGKDVLIARLVQRSGIPGQVVVSESTRRMIARRNFVYDTFDWQEHGLVEMNEPDISVKTYLVEQIFNQNDSSEKELDKFAEGTTPGKPDDAQSQGSNFHD